MQSGDALPGGASAYLRNVIRQPSITCRVCAAPVAGYHYCWQCDRARRITAGADVVAPLTYAIAGTASADLVRDYKNHPARSVREARGAVMFELVRDALARHERCLGYVVGQPVSCRLVIPSLTSRPGRHPFAELMHTMGALRDNATLIPAPDATCDRAINDKFVLQAATRLDDRHVLILDDVWTTGSNAQSAALAVRRAGAAAVSVLVVGRWLSPERRLTAEFVAAQLSRVYDPGICPVTGGPCP